MIDKTISITVKGRVLVSGTLWPVEFETLVPTSDKEFSQAIIDLSNWLFSSNVIPDVPMPAQVNSQVGATNMAQQVNGNGVGHQTNEPQPPNCPVHMTPMKVSRYKKKDGSDSYFCTKNDHGEYCKQKA